MKLQLILFLYLLTIINAHVEKRMISGRDAEQGVFPNVVAVYSTQLISSESQYLYSDGTLYNTRWVVVTARIASQIGHKVPYAHTRVIAGRINLSGNPPETHIRQVVLSRTYADQVNNVYGKSINLGLLKVNAPFTYNLNLWAVPFSQHEPDPSHPVVIIGFGATQLDQLRHRGPGPVLKILDDSVMLYSTCMNAMRTLAGQKLLSDVYVNRFNFCTGSYTKKLRGPSVGNFGNPVMQLNEKGELEVVGITSEGVAQMDLAVHTSISNFVPWIESEITHFANV